LKEKLGYENINDGTFWCSYEDWLTNFNTMYSCRIFPQNWSQFCIPGQWEGVSSGGAPPKKEDKDAHGNANEKTFTNKKTTMMGNIGGGTTGQGSIMNLSPDNKKGGLKSGNLQMSLHPIQEEGFQSSNIDKKHTTIINKMSNVFEGGDKSHMSNLHVSGFSGGKKSMINVGVDPNQSNMNVKVEKKEKEVKETATIKPRDTVKRIILKDSEDRWFLNPQYKIELKPGCRLIITLMQEDELLVNKPYHKCNFVIITTVSFTIYINITFQFRANTQEFGT